MPVDRAKMGRNNKSRGNGYELDIAKRVGGHRHPADTGGGEDIEHPEISLQVKSGKTVVTEVLRKGMASAKAAANYPAKLPAVALVDRRGTRLQRYIVFDLDQWCAWYGYPGATTEADEASDKLGTAGIRTDATGVDD